METKIINLLKYRGQNSSLFTGRPQGEAVRRELNLNEADAEKQHITFIIPKGTSSINPSFFLGLLFDSIKNHGYDEFHKYYTFEIEDTNPSTKQVLLDNIDDGKRNAYNTLNNKTGFSRFLNKG